MIIGKLNYLLPILINLDPKQLIKLHKLLMLTARQTLGSYCFRVSTHKILYQCNWVHIPHMIIISSIKFIHKIFNNKQPSCLLNEYDLRHNNKNSNRILTKFYPKIKPTISILKRSLLHKAAEIYNTLPDNIKILKDTNFDNSIKEYVIKTFAHDKIP